MSDDTDFERWKAFLTSFGIGFDVGTGNVIDYPNGEISIVVTAGEHAKVTGYFGMITQIMFDRDGKFLHVGLWE